mgnify:CR=1 FL=1
MEAGRGECGGTKMGGGRGVVEQVGKGLQADAVFPSATGTSVVMGVVAVQVLMVVMMPWVVYMPVETACVYQAPGVEVRFSSHPILFKHVFHPVPVGAELSSLSRQNFPSCGGEVRLDVWPDTRLGPG